MDYRLLNIFNNFSLFLVGVFIGWTLYGLVRIVRWNWRKNEKQSP